MTKVVIHIDTIRIEAQCPIPIGTIGIVITYGPIVCIRAGYVMRCVNPVPTRRKEDVLIGVGFVGELSTIDSIYSSPF